MKILKILFIVLISWLFYNCSIDYMLINFKDRKNIELLINEIYQNAKNNNIDYFKPIVGKIDTFESFFIGYSEEDKKKYLNNLRESYDINGLNDREVFEYYQKITFDGHIEMLRKYYKDYELTDDELLDLDITDEARYLMDQIIITNINTNYKRRLRLTMKGNQINWNLMNLDYHWDEKEIYFQIYLERVENKEWKLFEIWQCR